MQEEEVEREELEGRRILDICERTRSGCEALRLGLEVHNACDEIDLHPRMH